MEIGIARRTLADVRLFMLTDARHNQTSVLLQPVRSPPSHCCRITILGRDRKNYPCGEADRPRLSRKPRHPLAWVFRQEAHPSLDLSRVRAEARAVYSSPLTFRFLGQSHLGEGLLFPFS